ncbi:uncharacterized protein LOC131667835 [Phymastichus coffea]|uniref:uncharacterized protein LOC131667835 n=1 Tax=Phymastichus coffea TaxID=108790 RepID=UPI00273B3FAD|nr:uncharacterized protein LOC131667835 [Phymastichus coffea]
MAFSICCILIYVLYFNTAESTDFYKQDLNYVPQLKDNKFHQIKIKGMDRVPHKIQIGKDSLAIDFVNACSYKNGGCQHACLIKSSTKYDTSSCACYVGYKLKSNLKDCELIAYDSNKNTSESFNAPSGHRIRRQNKLFATVGANLK